MTAQLLMLLLLGLVIVAGIWFFGRLRRSRPNGQPASHDDALANPHDLTFETIMPGNAVVFWDETSALVETVMECQEHLLNRTAEWRWIFLSDDRIVASTSMGRTVYSSPTVFFQGSAPFAELTADVDRGGALKTFEERVREGTTSQEPVIFIYDGARYRVRSTGTFVATVKGKPMKAGPLADLSAEEGDNIYFKMQFGDDDEALGIWTTHIAFMTGTQLADSDIKGIYSR